MLEQSMNLLPDVRKTYASTAKETITEDIDLVKFAFKQSENLGPYILNKEDYKVYLPEFSLEQLCKLAGVPPKFVVKNPPSLNETILEYYYPLIENKTQQIRFITGDDGTAARGFLAPESTVVNNIDVLEVLDKVFGEDLYIIKYTGGTYMDYDTSLYIIDPSAKFVVNNEMYVPIYILNHSDVGANKSLDVDFGFYNMNKDFSLLKRLEGKPLISIPYITKEGEPELLDALRDELTMLRQSSYNRRQPFSDLVTSAQTKMFNKTELLDLLKLLKNFRDVSAAAIQAMIKEYKKKDEFDIYLWDVITSLLEEAKGKPKEAALQAFSSRFFEFGLV